MIFRKIINFFSSITLRKKIIFFSTFFMLILILIVNTAIYFLFYQSASEGELDQLTTHTDTLIETIGKNSSVSREEMSDLLTAYLPTNGMIRVIDENENDVTGKLAKSQEYTDVPIEYTTTERREVISFNQMDVAIVTKPIIWQNGEIVTIQVSDHLIHMNETMQTLRYVLFFSSAIILIPTIIASFLLSRFLLNPIQKLKETMQTNISKRDWQKIDIENRSKDELYEMEVTFNEMIDSLKENYEKQEIFVSNASHELKTPIQIIKSYAQLLSRRGEGNPELLQESTEAIDSEADRMQNLVEQMLALAKNQQEQVMETLDMRELLQQVTITFQKAYAPREINLLVDEKTKYVWQGNPDQIKQVIYILLTNALKYSEKEVHIRLQQQNDEMIVSVQDFGEGLAEQDQQHIFERFYRVDRARNRETGGTGLGLAIAKVIVESYQGEITVQSKIGEGSIFRIHLPNMDQ
ncbi:ATP-binding protein [Oceanobacillus kimchii]|uniref:sensor histidine kinase n=1 Tax=Oceanobacillus kimchii TaxID=746691 RepID=UPI003C73972E